MTSQITPNTINDLFPEKYSDNDSQIFRDNFNLIKSNFQIAKNEISALQQKPVTVVSSIADLRVASLTQINNGDRVTVLGFYLPGDGGAGDFIWEDPSVGVDDNATIISSVDSVTGKWIRLNTKVANIRYFGAYGNGVDDDSSALQAAISWAIEHDVPVYVPAGTYLIGPAIHDIVATLTGVHPKFAMFGDSSETSILKESDNRISDSGYTDCTMLHITTTELIESVTISNLTFDKSGSATAPSSPGSTENKDAHTISITVKAGGVLNNLNLCNVAFKDKIGAHLFVDSGQINVVYAENLSFGEFNYTGHEYGDILSLATITSGYFNHINGRRLEVLPTDTAPLNSGKCSLSFLNCNFNIANCSGFSETADGMEISLLNTNFLYSSFSTVRLQASMSSIGTSTGAWGQLAAGSFISNSKIIINVNQSNHPIPLDIDPSIGNFDCYLTIENTSVVGSSSFLNTTNGYVISSTGVFSSVAEFNVTFSNCIFDSRFESIINANGTGNFTFSNCTLACRGVFATLGSYHYLTDDVYGSIVIDSCNIDNTNQLIEYDLNITSPAFVKFKGDLPYDKWTFSIAPGSNSSLVPVSTVFDCVWRSTTAPAGPGIVNQLVSLSNVAYGDPCTYIATTTSDTSATWEVSARAIQTITQSELTTQLNSAISVVNSAVSNETSLRVSGDATLQSNIDDETGARILGDQNLQTQVDALVTQASTFATLTQLTTETTARTNADNAITSAIGALSLSIAQETADRVSGDAALQSQIDVITGTPAVGIPANAVATYASLSNYATDSGTANAYVINSQAYSLQAPPSLVEGTIVRFKALNDCTGASTLSYLGSGVIPLVNSDMTSLKAGNVVSSRITEATYTIVSGNPYWILTTPRVDTPDQQIANKGYTTLPGGIIIQWGVTASISSVNQAAQTFYTSFPNHCFTVVSTPIDVGSTSQSHDYVTNISQSGFTQWNAASASCRYNWIAIGW